MEKIIYPKLRIKAFFLAPLFLLLLAGFPLKGWAVGAVHAVKSGNWSDNTVWNTNTVPTSVNTVTIGSGYSVIVDLAGEKCSTLTLGDGSGSGSLVFNAGATLTMSGILTIGNTFPGNIDMTNGGILSIAKFSITNAGTWIPGSGSVILTGTAQTLPTTFVTSFNNLTIYLSSGVVKLSFKMNIANSLNIALGGLDLAGYGLTAGDLQGIKQLTNSGANQTVTVGGDGNSTVFSGIIQNGTGTITLVKNGTGTLTLLGANTYSGGTYLNAGEIDIDSPTAIGTGLFTISAGTTIDNTSGAPITLINSNTQLWNGNFTFRGSNDLNLGTGTVTLGTSPSVSVLGGTLTVGGTINDLVNSLTTVGSGTFSLASQTVQLNSLSMGSGSFISTSSSLSLTGNFSDSGTFSNNNGSVILNGTALQTISALSIPEAFNNLLFNNPSGATLYSPLSVSGSLNLSNGIINSNDSTDIIYITSTGGTSGGKAASYINGPMAKIGNSAFLFPIGGSGRYMPLAISGPATATDTILAKYTFASPVNPFSVNSPLTSVSTIEYWTISESVPTDAVYVRLYWQNASQSGISTFDSTVRVSNYSGGLWYDLGQSAITATTSGNVTSNSTISNFSNVNITFGTINNNSNPLPVTLTSFNATYIAESNSVLTNWDVASQLNNNEFTVEKTLDGIHYSLVGNLPGAGTTPFAKSYSLVDNNPIQGMSYYRLKQTDMDGYSVEFPPVAVFDGTIPTGSITIYPNPVVENTTLNYISEDNAPISVSIADLTGRIISSTEFSNVKTGENTFSINTATLNSGIYLLQVTNSKKSFYQKILKQ